MVNQLKSLLNNKKIFFFFCFKAKFGDRSYHMIDQIQILRQRLDSNKYCNMNDDWKMITFFIGVNEIHRNETNQFFCFLFVGK